MNLIIDDKIGEVAPGRGIERVFTSLLRSLKGDHKHAIEKIIVLSRSGRFDPFADDIVYLPREIGNTQEENLYISNVCRGYSDSVFCSTYYSSPVGIPTTAIVHDLIPEKMGIQNLGDAWRQRISSFKLAHSLLTVSRKTMMDLGEYYPDLSHKARESRIGFGIAAGNPENIEEPCDLYNQNPGEYFLMVGDRSSYKNGDRVVKYAQRGALILPLVVVGGLAIQDKSTNTKAKGNGNFELKQLFPDDEELASLYKGATATLITSFYEGFGLPARESVLAGTPVISLKGVVSEASFDTAIEIPSFKPRHIDWAVKIAKELRPEIRGRVEEFRLKDRSDESKFLEDFISSLNRAKASYQSDLAK